MKKEERRRRRNKKIINERDEEEEADRKVKAEKDVIDDGGRKRLSKGCNSVGKSGAYG